MARASLGSLADRATAPGSAFGAVAAAGRRAAFRRRLVRRALAGMLVVLALVVLLRPALSTDAGAGAAEAGSAESEEPGGDGGGLLPSLPGIDDPETDPPATAPWRAGPGDTAGATAVPGGHVAVSIPIDPHVGRRLVAGDVVDVYAPDTGKPVATGAIVIDVTRPEDEPAGNNSVSGTGVASANLFLALPPPEGERIFAGQSPDAGPLEYRVVVLPRRPEGDSRGA